MTTYLATRPSVLPRFVRPLLPVSLYQIVGLLRAPRSSRIERDSQGVVENGREQLPRRLDFVGVNEERLVAIDHIEQQRLIRLGQLLESFLVEEVERQPLQLERLARRLHVEVERESLVRLNR